MAVKGSGIYMHFTDVHPQYEEEFNAWYDTEHLPDVLAVPGVLSAARYVACKGAPKYLAVYELSNSDVATSSAFQKIRQELTPWGRRMLSPSVSGQNVARVLGEQFYPARVEMLDRSFAPVLQIGRHLVPVEIEEAWNAWYNEEYVVAYRKVPGMLYARRYHVVEGACKYMTVYELEHEKVSGSEAWENQRRLSSPLTASMRKVMTHAPGSGGVAGLYRRHTS